MWASVSTRREARHAKEANYSRLGEDIDNIPNRTGLISGLEREYECYGVASRQEENSYLPRKPVEKSGVQLCILASGHPLLQVSQAFDRSDDELLNNLLLPFVSIQ